MSFDSPIPEEDPVWDIMDALCDQTQQTSIDHDAQVSLIQALSTDFDASAFGARRSSFSSGTSGSAASWHEDVEIPNFPPLSEEMLKVDYKGRKKSADGVRTSEPISKGVREGQENQLLDLVTKKRFLEVLDTPMGMVRFREWVNEEGRAESKGLLRYYEDTKAYAGLLDEVKAVTQGMQAVYGNVLGQKIPSPTESLPALSTVSLGMHTAQSQAVDRLYATEFKRFIAGKITERAKARLELFPAHSERGDLGEVFCIADPRLPDQPLVYVSDGFCKLSEYLRSRLVGRNCRFLQGPATDPEAVRLLREAINAGKEHCSLLLNYSRLGRPFWNLLNMIPLRNANGQIDFFLGAQVNVSRALTSQDAFEALMGTHKSGTDVPSGPSLSTEVLRKAETYLGRPTSLRPQISPAPPVRIKSSVTSSRPTTPTTPTLDTPSSGRMHKWLNNVRTKSTDQVLPLQPYPRDPLAPIPFPQQVPDAVRDQVNVFTSAYSNLIVFDAKCRLIQYVTAPLLARLGHPIRLARDRLSSTLLRTDILDLLAGQSSSETTSLRSTISHVISTSGSHSLFAGVYLSDARRGVEGGNGKVEGEETSSEGRRFTRSLLHFTPLKDGQDEAQIYIVVVG